MLILYLSYVITVVSALSGSCTYTHLQRASILLSVDGVPVVSNSVNDETGSWMTNTGQVLSIECVDTTQDFAYNEPKVYTCPDGGNNDVTSLPYCVAKCSVIVTLSDAVTSFKDEMEVVVSGDLRANTPVTIVCPDMYSQKLGVGDNQKCEDWTVGETCKKMCLLSAYDSDTTKLESAGMKGSYLSVGYSVIIKCLETNYALPMGEAGEITCTDSENIAVPKCKVMCVVPAVPAYTQYHSTQNRLRAGESFSVSCQGDLKLPFQSVSTATCQGADGFTDIPVCKETCQVSATSSDTTIDNGMDGSLAEGDSVNVVCNIAEHKLPYPYSTPLEWTCNLERAGGPDFITPSCQTTCPVPASPDKATVQPPRDGLNYFTAAEPVTVECIAYYSFIGSSDFICTDGVVTIEEECYVYAKLLHMGAGTNKVTVTAEIGAGISTTGVSVEIVVDNNPAVIVLTPNAATTIDVGSYMSHTVTVRTTSQVDKIVSRSFSGVYPGPPPPTVQQDASTTNTATLGITKPADIDVANLVWYHITYGGNPYTTTDSTFTLTDLQPASPYTVDIVTELTGAFGGMGTTLNYNVYTGPSKVTNFAYSVSEDMVTLSWDPVAQATKYSIDFNNQQKTSNQVQTTLKVVGLAPSTTYSVVLKASLLAADTYWYGDSITEDVISGPAAPSASSFTVTNTSDSITISLRQNTVGKRATQEYIVFINGVGGNVFSGQPLTLGLSLSTVIIVKIAEKVGDRGYGLKSELYTMTTADCRLITCSSCDKKTSQIPQYVVVGNVLLAKCPSGDNIETEGGTKVNQLQLTCNDKGQYVSTEDANRIYRGDNVICTNQGAVTGSTNNTAYYVVGAIGFLIIAILLIILVVVRKRRSQGSYNAKRVKETAKKGGTPEGMTAPTFTSDNAYFENRYNSTELLGRTASMRSKATTYASQEIRMEIDDSDSGITEDLDHTIFNPNMYSTHCDVNDDTVSTKSALV